MSQLTCHVGFVLFATAGLACQGTKANGAENGAQPHPIAKPAPPVTTPPLDETGPRVDLIASSALWHMHRQGLVIPFAGEGFRKYSQEYKNPWKGVTRIDERTGRVLRSTAATLHFPWPPVEGEATLMVRVHGGSCGRKLSLRMNGKPVKNTALEAGWQEVTANIPARAMNSGENTLALATGKKGGVFHSVEIVPGKSAPTPGWPAASPVATITVGGRRQKALVGFPRLRIPIEIPRDSWLVVGTGTTAGPVRFQVLVTEEGRPAKSILDDHQDAGIVRERRMSLADFGGKLVALDLVAAEGSPAEAAWLAPRILLPKNKVASRPSPARNVVVLVADALRADKLPMYAKTRVHTPNIAKTAAAIGVTFSSALAASPSSPPSHASIQSGCMPRVHGILGDKSKVNPGTPMVSAVLAKAGIATDFIGDASFAMRRLLPVSSWTEFHQPNSEGKGADCSAVVKEILAFADTHKEQRFFISSVAFEAHTPYIYHRGTTEHYYDGPFDDAIGKRPDGVTLTAIVGGRLKMTPQRWDQLKGLYDGEVEHLDACFGALMDGLRSRGLADNTPVVLLADHGEGFLEHGSMGHAYGQYAELTHVPLVLFAAGLGHGQTIDTVVSHTDVVPTIVDLMGLPPDPRVQGESLVPMVLRQGPWVPRVVPSEYGRSYSLRSLDLHYIVDYGGNEYLYDLVADPTEKTDLRDKRPLALRYFRDLAGLYLAHRTEWRASRWGTLNNHGPGFPTTPADAGD